jgi:hypothetical protein
MMNSLSLEEVRAQQGFAETRDDRRMAAWLIGSGAVLVGGTGLLLYLLDTPRAPSPTFITRRGEVAVTPAVGPDRAGVVVAGTF